MCTVLRGKVLMLLAVCLLGLGIWGLGSQTAPARANPQSDSSGQLISPELLDHAGLRQVWQQQLPVKKDEDLATVTLLGDRLYIRSDRNYMWSLDRVKGDVVFSRSIAPRGIPVLGLVAYGNRLITVVGNQLVELDEETGIEQRVSDLELSIIAPPVRNSQFFYVSGADRRLHVFRAKDLVRVFKVAAENDSLITTVIADENVVVFGTAAGNLVAMMPDAPRKLWQFDAPEAISGPVQKDNNSFYFASVDTNVYRVDMVNFMTRVLTWKYQTEAVLDRAPRLTDGFVYQYAPGRGLTAIAKQTGQAAWSLPEGVDLLAEAGSRAYVITGQRTLTVMDNTTGRKLSSVNFAPVTDHAANTMDARIYIADENGRVACLEPTR
jgi:outer membrane protein assembly factor BamB